MDRARIVQLSDTHFSAPEGAPAQWPAVLAWLRADPPDLVVHSGDIVFEDPDDDADRAFAKDLLDAVPAPLVVIPGNHDVGSYGEEDLLPGRLSTFVATWGADRFTRDLAGWRVVGVDAYLLGIDEKHDAWFAGAVRADRPVLVFVHQPVRGDGHDEWVMADRARAAFDAAVAGADVRVIASGHRHRAHRIGPSVWAPSLTLTGPTDDRDLPGDVRPGLLEHVVADDGSHEVEVLRPWHHLSASAPP
jgi:3',5'-cyclic AMP phosphodiesterase CpdA